MQRHPIWTRMTQIAGLLLVLQRNHGAAVSAQGRDPLQIAIRLWNCHNRAVAVNRVTTGREVPSATARVLGQLARGLRQGLPGT
jgi:hypothetical protein